MAQAKKTSPLFWLVLGAGAIAAYVLTTPEDVAKAAPRPKTKKSTTAGKTDMFIEADYKAKFEDLTVAPKNVFKPLVMKTMIATGPPPLPGGIPALLAGGDGNWMYTGLVEIDGKPQGLLENLTTGDSAYVAVGERWRSATVQRVDSNAIVMAGADGTPVKVLMGDKSTMTAAPAGGIPGAPAPLPGSLAPVAVVPPPGVRGAVGPLDVTPLADTAAPTDTQTRGNGRRRGRRANNGGQDGF